MPGGRPRRNGPGTCRVCGLGEPEVEFFKGHAAGICRICERKRKSDNKKKNIKSDRARKIRSLERIRKYLREYKANSGCTHCNEYDVDDLEFHHLDPSEKEFTMGKARSWAQVERELPKCIVLCCSCHIKAHGKNPINRPRKKGRPLGS